MPIFDTDDAGNIFQMNLDGKKLVLDEIWQQISNERCGQFCAGRCLTRNMCKQGQSYCYPVSCEKKANKVVAVMFAWWCVDQAEITSARVADAADAARAAGAAYAADAAAGAARAADAAAGAAGAARAADAAAGAARAADAAYAAARAAYAAARAADAAYAAARAAAGAARAADGAAARDQFYLDASHEIERLVNAWGTPKKGEKP